MKFRITFIWLALLIVLVPMPAIAQQTTTPVECGTILEAEWTENNLTHNYGIRLSPGDAITVRIEPIGDTLEVRLRLYDPQNEQLTDNWSTNRGRPLEREYTVAATGNYTIQTYAWRGNKIGAYTLLVGCALRNGTIIAPGDVVQPIPASDDKSEVQPPAPTFSGHGFPGLAPVDFAQGVTIPLTLGGTANPGTISDSFVGIFGFSFSANAGERFTLQFTRQSGNLNLGLAVITSNNVVVFESTLMSSSVLLTEFTLPVTGDYTIGVYRSELLQPTTPEATAFQITGTIKE